jgi:hypothetical protein
MVLGAQYNSISSGSCSNSINEHPDGNCCGQAPFKALFVLPHLILTAACELDNCHYPHFIVEQADA